MTDLVQILVTGFSLGSVLALVALGYNLVFSTTRIVNFAQGTLLVVAGYVAFAANASLSDQRVTRVPWEWTILDLPIWVAFLAAVAITALVGALVQVVAIKPLGRFDPRTNVGWILTTFGVGLVLTNVITTAFGSESRPVRPLVSSLFGWRGSRVADVFVGVNDVLLVAVAVGLVAAVEVLQRRTMIGRAFRAVAQDRQAASLMGIDPERMVLVTFALAGALAAVAAMLLVPRQQGLVTVIPTQLLGIQAFVAAVIGGLGSTRGALLGGYALAFVSAITTTLTSSRFEPLVVFAVFLAVLVLRPTGLLGERVVEKV